ncbi:hypothetical protein Lgra_2203 [Legionella gratiana]|uniref:Substrate of the Dot/Icm secretion system n=1 Tax=Legionella gratiana TaxID=45066 RepID=A0A378JM50_9GAMM|nr:RhoGAP domain-containing protein [Legionella gratiana]KTD08968.1 hypothetical protein Lgra_2203 [Legionella gratiana]STX45820.1 substrate of the Dot/Icm secretion system [Legionella gratiana]
MPKPDAKQLKIERLQNAALKLMILINSELDKSAPEGLFRISPEKALIDTKMDEIQNGALNFEPLQQIQRAALLKRVLRELQNEDAPLFSYAQFNTLKKAKETGDKEFKDAISKLEMDAMNRNIACHLFKLLNNVSEKAQTLMDASNLGIMLGPNVFEIPKELNPLAQLGNVSPQNEIVAELVTLQFQPQMSIHYKHEVDDARKNRFHAFEASPKDLQNFKDLKGDLLKSKILHDFKGQLENATADNIDQVVEKIKNSKEYKVLATGQGVMTRLLHLDTSSVNAFNEMVAERKDDFELEKSFNPMRN